MGLTKNWNTSKKINSNNKTIALIGNPNVGKSTIFNALTKMHQHTGNWPGKTVSSASGTYKYNEKKYNVVDLPGTYSLFASSKEEEVSRDYVCFSDHDLTVIVLDATMIERNLNLATQIIETNDNVIVCVNLLDEAKKRGIKINVERLKEILKVPVIGMCANKKKDIERLIKAIEKYANKKSSNENIINYGDTLEVVIKKMEVTLNSMTDKKNVRFFALKLLEKNAAFENEIIKFFNLDSKQIELLKKTQNECKKYLKNRKISNVSEMVTNKIIENNSFISKAVVSENEKKKYLFDKVVTSKIFGIPIMILFLAAILWITISGANAPSEFLSKTFFSINEVINNFLISINAPDFIRSLLVDGVLKTLAWVIAVMLPPMAIFFPLFTLLEDSGFLPRIAFNLDRLFSKAKCHGKQALTMCMGFGCNACGVAGCRIIDSPRERLIAILTNSLVPCNGRFPSLIAIITMFLAVGISSSFKAALILTLVIIFSIVVTLLVSKILSLTVLKGMPSSFVLEMPPYRKPQIGKVIVRSVFDRTLFVLGRAISVAAPAGLIIWLLANITIDGASILSYCTNFLDPIGQVFGLDGTILMAFILGFPANEIVIPIIIMSYMQTTSLTDYNSLFELKNLLINNGWTITTAICMLIFTLFHFPCGTTLLTIKKETKSKFWTILAFIIPTLVGLSICFLINLISKVI